MIQRFLQAAGNTMLSMVSLVVGAGTNIILDPIMIFGLWGFPSLGIQGAAIATVIGQWLGAITALVLHLIWNKDVHLTFKDYRWNWDMVKKIYRVGFPTILTQAMGSIMISAMNRILMPFSSTAVAFFGVYYKLQNFLFMPISGLGQAALPIVGYNYGSKNKGRILETIKDGILAAVMIALTGMGNGVVNMISCLLRQLVLLVPFAWLLGRCGGIGMVWFAFWISELCAAGYSVVSLRRELRKKQLSQ